MQIFTKLAKNTNLSLALGYFDGVHLGHQKVISTAVNYAHKNGNKSAVITFKDHPCCFFKGVCPKYILTREDRLKHLEALGVDYVYILDFDAKLCLLSADEYLKNILIDNFSPKSISTGFNHYFGSKKSGGVDLLSRLFTAMNILKYRRRRLIMKQLAVPQSELLLQKVKFKMQMKCWAIILQLAVRL